MLAQRPGPVPAARPNETKTLPDGTPRAAILALPHSVQSLNAGKYIVREGDRPDHCYVLLDGFAYRQKIVAYGGRQIVAIHVRGDLLYVQETLLGEADHNIQALTAVTVAVIPRKSVLDLMRERPEVAEALLRDALVKAATSHEWMANVGRRDSRSRTSHLLCELLLKQQEAGLADNDRFELPMTQEQLADALGLTSVHINRTLKLLETEGLIARHKRSIKVQDWQALKKAGDFDAAYLHLPAPSAGALSKPWKSAVGAHW